jgi:hypothetical protein
MSAEGTARVEELLEQASRIPSTDGAAVQLLEEAARVADTLADVPLGYRVREQLIPAACWSGHLDKMIVAFAWCLAQYDRDPERYAMRSLYWRYKWVVNEVVIFPQIALGKMIELFDDMAARYARAGISLRPVHSFRCYLEMVRGDEGEAARHYQAWIEAPRDSYSNCHACELDERVGYHAFRRSDEEAMRQAAPMMTGKMRCAEVPHRTYARVLGPLLRLGRVDEAADAHRRGFPLLKPGHKLLEFAGEHLAFLALTGNLGRAVKALEQYLPYAVEMRGRLDGFLFLLDARLLLDRLTAEGTTSIRMRLPRNTPVWQEEARYDVAALDAWMKREVAATAAAFDRRNGTTYTSRTLETSAARASLACVYPLDREGSD